MYICKIPVLQYYKVFKIHHGCIVILILQLCHTNYCRFKLLVCMHGEPLVWIQTLCNYPSTICIVLELAIKQSILRVLFEILPPRQRAINILLSYGNILFLLDVYCSYKVTVRFKKKTSIVFIEKFIVD